MATNKQFWDFLLTVRESLNRSIYKRAILRGQLTLVAISVGMIYIVIDYANNIYIAARENNHIGG